MTRHKHKPQRTCIVCREIKDKRELIRVVRTPAGSVTIDPTGKANGRGAYLCRQASCWDSLHRERLAKALKANLSVEELAVLQAAIQTELAKN